MSDADSVGISYIEEVTWGVTPSGNLQRVRQTNESLRQETQTAESNEIRSDGQVPYFARTSLNGAGDLGIELSYGAHEDLIAAAIRSAGWSSAVTNGPATTISFAAASGGSQVISDSANGFGSFNVNQWVKISGSSESENNGIFKISAAAAGSITVNNAVGVVDPAGDSVTVVMGAQIVNGTTLRSFSWEKEFTDLSNEFTKYLGMAVDQMNLAINAGQIITGGFTFLGKSEASATATIGTGYTAAPTNDVMNATDDIDAIFEDGAVFGSTQFSVAVNGQLRQRPQIAALGPISLGKGRFQITGNLDAYFTSKTIMDKYRNFTKTAVASVAQDASGNAYVVDLPRIRFNSGQQTAGGPSQDVMAAMGFTAYMHETEGITIRIVKFDA